MIYKIVCAGNDTFSSTYHYDENEIIIAVDGGYKTLLNNNIKVDYFFGDFDSLGDIEVECQKVMKYNVMKDKGDFELAIDYLVEIINVDSNDYIYVYNATGGRLDHYYAILNTLIKNKKLNIIILDKCNKIYLSGLETEIKKTNYKYISFYSIDNDTIISISGCKYNIDKYQLQLKDNLCLSNEIIDCCKIVTNKKVLIIESN